MDIDNIVDDILADGVYLLERKLSDKARKKVPKSKEGVPGKHGEVGSYPMPDKQHAAAAKGFAAMHHGKGSDVYKKVAKKAEKLYDI